MTDEQDTRTIHYFVREGRMMSGWKIVTVNIEPEFVDGDDFSNIVLLLTGMEPRSIDDIQTDHIARLVNRPGVWCLMSGMRIVHEDDVYPTREDAAEAYKEKLIHGD